jgi:hypothetical protein
LSSPDDKELAFFIIGTGHVLATGVVASLGPREGGKALSSRERTIFRAMRVKVEEMRVFKG